jgi:hypothetical protein
MHHGALSSIRISHLHSLPNIFGQGCHQKIVLYPKETKQNKTKQTHKQTGRGFFVEEPLIFFSGECPREFFLLEMLTIG